jgi:hypothetical protein
VRALPTNPASWFAREKAKGRRGGFIPLEPKVEAAGIEPAQDFNRRALTELA